MDAASTTSAASAPRVPGEHFAIATVFLVAGALGLVWIAPDLAAGNFLAPRVGAVTHLFTLGWLTITIFGALTQLIPTSLGTPICSARLARLAAWALALGVVALDTGIVAQATGPLAAGVLLVIAGVLMAVGNFAVTLRRARTRDVTWAAIAIAIAYLVIVLGFGAVLAHNLHTGFVAAHRVRLTAAHLHLALIGWVLLVIVGVSTRLLPMFLMAHRVEHTANRVAVALLAVGVALLATGLALSRPVITWPGAVLVYAGFIAFIVQVVAFYRGRTRRKVDAGMAFARMGVIFLAAGAVLGGVLLVAGHTRGRLATAYIVTVLLGGLVLFVTGFSYKIIPLLAWTARFSGRSGPGPMPMAGDLFSARVALVHGTLTAVAVLGMLVGIAAASASIVADGAVLYACAILIYAWQVARIRWGTPTPRAALPTSPQP
jgi:hypothetical protein